jgi:hypothetical protein
MEMEKVTVILGMRPFSRAIETRPRGENVCIGHVFAYYQVLLLCAYVDDIRTWIKENPVDAATFSRMIKELAAKVALREKEAA